MERVTGKQRHDAKLAELADEYRRDGYLVSVEPTGSELPEFLRGRQPDMLARRGAEAVVVEVKIADGRSQRESWSALASAIESQPGWHFRLVIVGGDEKPDVDYSVVTPATITSRLERARELAPSDPEAGLLLGWSAFEAAARRVLFEQGASLRAITPAGLSKQLVHRGLIEDDDMQRLNAIAQRRNVVAHGGAAPEQSVADVEALAGFARTLLAA